MDAKKFKEIREKLEMSQEKFAQALEISFATVNRIETGKSEIDNQTEKKLLQLEELMNSDKIVSIRELRFGIMQTGLSEILSGAIAAGLINVPIAVFTSLGKALGIGNSLFSWLPITNMVQPPKDTNPINDLIKSSKDTPKKK